MTQANFVFLNADDKSVQLYFEVEGEIVEVKWGNPDYIADHLAQFGVKNADELSDKLTKLGTVEIYEFSRMSMNMPHATQANQLTTAHKRDTL